LKKGDCVFLEVGPGKVLSELTRRGHPDCIAVHSFADDTDGRSVAQAVAGLWAAGVEIDWGKYYRRGKRDRGPLPTYPFERQRYWPNTREASETAAAGDPLAVKDTPENWFYTTNWKRTNPLPKPEPDEQGWLVFSEPTGVGAEIASWLRRTGRRMWE